MALLEKADALGWSLIVQALFSRFDRQTILQPWSLSE